MRTDIENIWAQHIGRIKTDWDAVANKPNTNPLLESIDWEFDNVEFSADPEEVSAHDQDMLDQYAEWARSAGNASTKDAFIAGFEASSRLAYIAASQGDNEE